MPDDAQPPSADAPTPEAPGNDAAPPAAVSGAARDTWAAPVGGPLDGIADAVPGVGLDKPGPSGPPGGPGTPGAFGGAGTPDRDAQPAVPRPGPGPEDRSVTASGPVPGFAPGPVPDPWAPPVNDAVPAPDSGSGTLASDGSTSWPAPSVHDQQTVTSIPATGAPQQQWAAPAAPANPFAAPDPAAAATGAPNPFAPPASPSPPYVQDRAAVPPPPIAPDGPGQVPYGYPGPAGYPGPQPQGYYGWPGMAPMPSNGMGTAGLVLGIIAAVIFCLWPLAIIAGILGVVFGGLGRAKAHRGEATNGGQALAGIICGAVGTALGVGFGLLIILTP